MKTIAVFTGVFVLLSVWQSSYALGGQWMYAYLLVSFVLFALFRPQMVILGWIVLTPMIDKFNLISSANILSVNLYKNFDPTISTLWFSLNMVILPLLIAIMVLKRLRLTKVHSYKEYLLFIGWATVAILWAIDPSDSIRKVSNLYAFIVYGVWAANFFRTEQDKKLLFQTVILAGLIYLPYYYLQIIEHRGGMFDIEAGMRARGPEPNANSGSFLLLPAIWATYFLGVRSNGLRPQFKRAVAILIFISLLGGFLLCQSRANTVIMVFGLVLGSMYLNDKVKMRAAHLVESAFAGGILILLFVPIFEDRLGLHSIETLEGRTIIWQTVLNYITHGSVLLGTGYGSLGELSLLNKYLAIPHSFFLEIWLELGMVGLSFFLLFLYSTGKGLYLSFKKMVYGDKGRLYVVLSFLVLLLMLASCFTEVIVSSMNAAFAAWVLIFINHDQNRRAVAKSN